MSKEISNKAKVLILALVAALVGTGCKETKPSQKDQTPAPPPAASSSPSPSASPDAPVPATDVSSPAIANWGSEEAKRISAEGINSITARLGVEADISAIDTLNYKTELVDLVGAMKIIFDGFKDQLDSEVREDFFTELQALGTGIDRIANLTGDELATAVKDSRRVASRLAVRLAKMQEELGIVDPSIEAAEFLIQPGVGFGAISKDSTTESIRARYGAENYVMEERTLAPDFTTKVGILFPGDKEKELWVIFEEGKIAQLRVPNTSETSKWKTVDGLGLGSSLEEVYKVNGTHFEMNGLMQEYAGAVKDWRGGRLDSLTMSIAAPFDDQGKFKALTGDSIASDDPLLKELQPKVYSLGIQF